MDSTKYQIKDGPTDGKKVFRKLKTCSRTFFHILNREFGHIKEQQERASDSLAGGIMQKGHQCGMLWGASLAVGAEAYRICDNLNQAIALTVNVTKELVESFVKREKTTSCREITNCDFSSKLSFAKYMVSGRFLHCFDLAEKWAPEAVRTAIEGLSKNNDTPPSNSCISCATEVAKKMGASEEQMVMVAGFAGGLGLSGSGCGALSAAIWLKSLDWCHETKGNSSFLNPNSKKVLETFCEATDTTIECSAITGRHFANLDEHASYIKNGGCASLINILSTT